MIQTDSEPIIHKRLYWKYLRDKARDSLLKGIVGLGPQDPLLKKYIPMFDSHICFVEYKAKSNIFYLVDINRVYDKRNGKIYCKCRV